MLQVDNSQTIIAKELLRNISRWYGAGILKTYPNRKKTITKINNSFIPKYEFMLMYPNKIHLANNSIVLLNCNMKFQFFIADAKNASK